MDRIRLDMHAHLAPILPERLAELPSVEWRADSNTLTLDGRSIAMRNLFRPDALIEWLDANRIDQAWISAPPPTYRQHLAPDDARIWTRYLNDGLADIAALYPGRLSALSHLPIEHPDLAAAIAAEEIARPPALRGRRRRRAWAAIVGSGVRTAVARARRCGLLPAAASRRMP